MNHIPYYKLSIIFISILLWYWFIGSTIIHDILSAKKLQKQYHELACILKKPLNNPPKKDTPIKINTISHQSFIASLYQKATQYKIKICSLEKREHRIVQQTIQQTDYDCIFEGPFVKLYSFITENIAQNNACKILSLIVSAGGGDHQRTISMKVRYLCSTPPKQQEKTDT